MQVIKRDNSVVEFDKSKIREAIMKSMKNGSGIYVLNIAELIANDAEKYFKNKIDFQRLKVMNEEQSKISRNLHDGVAQDLAALKLYLEKEDLPKSKFYAQQAFNEVRYMIGATHLDLNQSFEEIVRKMAATLEANYNISTKVYVGSTKIQNLNENIQVELIRILQESLSNISRHANASNVEIRFVDGIDDFKFIIKDDGKGFGKKVRHGRKRH